MKNTFSKFEAISIVVIITITQIILNMPEYLVDLTGTGTLVNIIYIAIIGYVLCFIIFKIFKNFPNLDILDLAEALGGKILKFLLSSLFIIFFAILAITAISSFTYLIKSLYFSNHSTFFILMIFAITALFANLRGLTAIKKIICLFLPLFILSIIFLNVGTFEYFDINNFFPILGYNVETTFLTGLQNISILNFLWIYFFIIPKLEKKNDFKSIIFSSFTINIILVILSVIAILSIFPTLSQNTLAASNNLSTIYLITRRIKLNSFVEQTDILFLFIWIISCFCYVSFFIYSISHVLSKLFHFENKSKTSFPIILIILGICLITNKFGIIRFLEGTVIRYFSIAIIAICFIIMLLGNLKKRK